MPDDADPLAWRTLASDVAYACPGFDVVHEDVQLPDGTDTDFDYLREPPAVIVLPFTANANAVADDPATADGDDEVVVIEEWRQAVSRVNRGLPAGSVETDDADATDEAPGVRAVDDASADGTVDDDASGLAAAARRELREETGYAAGEVAHLCTFEPANGLLNSVFHVFVATGCTPAGDQDLDFNESIRVETTTFADLLAAVRDGEVRDGRTHVAVTRYALERALAGDASAVDEDASSVADGDASAADGDASAADGDASSVADGDAAVPGGDAR